MSRSRFFAWFGLHACCSLCPLTEADQHTGCRCRLGSYIQLCGWSGIVGLTIARCITARNIAGVVHSALQPLQ